jgi:hypothetical protein
MKKGIVCLALLFLSNSAFAYQQQWFTSYEEKDNKISFTCTKECALILGAKESNNLVQVSWVQWSWQIIVWVIAAGNQIFPIKILPSQTSFQVLVESVNGQVLPAQAPVALIFQWNMNMQWWTISLANAGRMTKFGQWWDEFWTFDTFRPYTINLLKGPMAWGRSANNIFFYIFLLGAIFIFIKHGKKRRNIKKYIFMLWLIVWVMYDIRMWAEMIWYYHHDYVHYISPTSDAKTYRDRGDFYRFVEFTKREVDNQWLSTWDVISFKSDIPWPFPWSMSYFLYPYTVTYNYTGDTKATAVYLSSSFVLSGDAAVLSWVVQTGTIKQFSKNAFIFFK